MKKTKIKKESLMIVIALTVLALASAIILSVLNVFTHVSEDEAIKRKFAELNIKIVNQYDISTFKAYSQTELIYAAKTEEGGFLAISHANKTAQNCYGAEGISVIVIIKDNVISKVLPYTHAETPGLGSKALDPGHLSQYSGLDIDRIDISESPSLSGYFNPKTVTSATYSTNGVHAAVKNAVKAYVALFEIDK